MIKEYRFTLLYAFLLSLAVFLFGLYYKLFNPYYFIGLWFRSLWLVIIFGFLTIISFVDFKKLSRATHKKNLKSLFKILSLSQEKPRTIINWLFQITLVLYLTLLVVNEFIKIKYGLNTLLVLTIIFATLTIIYPEKKKKKEETFGYKEKALIIILSIIGFILVYLKTKQLGWISYLISIITALIIFFVGYLIYEDDEKDKKETEIKISNRDFIVYTLITLFLVSIVLYFFIGLNAFRYILGSAYVLFLPGFVLSYAFFDKKEMDSLERIALSFALSIAVVPLTVFYFNLIGMKINLLNISLIVLGITIIGGIIYAYRRNKRRN